MKKNEWAVKLDGLRECPCCGRKNIQIVDSGNGSYIMCNDCLIVMYQLEATCPEDNIEAWNKRHNPEEDVIHCGSCMRWGYGFAELGDGRRGCSKLFEYMRAVDSCPYGVKSEKEKRLKEYQDGKRKFQKSRNKNLA